MIISIRCLSDRWTVALTHESDHAAATPFAIGAGASKTAAVISALEALGDISRDLAAALRPVIRLPGDDHAA